MEKLIKYFKDAGFDAMAIEKMLPLFVKKSFKRGEYFLQEGSLNSHLGIVESGHFMLYTLDKGVEKCTLVVGGNGVIASLWSFIEEKPARENIRCINKGNIWLISKERIQGFLQEIPGFSEFYISLLEREITCIEQSRYDLITLNAQERYEKMVHEQPELIQNIPLRYLASILGITPRHLSRIRAKRF